ncbi:hypothetical protein BDP27DRAFT_1367230 [Rhodocollybia butyracea]|uniref:Uncharacterized protein n=1 Tax=Rhodocollybia butyracea TaxID=206335 RepID=A0A9P5PLW3_9AGAR|nr:hypothetical protein BDP27DRAFT_1367230 [Rhodocollybia butyracea]
MAKLVRFWWCACINFKHFKTYTHGTLLPLDDTTRTQHDKRGFAEKHNDIIIMLCSRLAFVEDDKSQPFPNDSGGIQLLNLRIVGNLASKSLNAVGQGSAQLSHLRLKLRKKYAQKDKEWKTEHSQLPNSGIAKLARVGVGDPYGIVAELARVGDFVPSTLSSVEIFNRTKDASQSGRNITFSTSDIREYPSYLQKLQTFWDDDLPTWDPRNICPTIGGERLAAKDWKMVFSKVGHWRALMSGLESHGYSVERFLQAHWDMDREQGLGIKVITKYLREQKQKKKD